MTETLNVPINLIITRLIIIMSLTIFGYLAGQFRLVTDEGYSSLSNLVIFITMPASFFTATVSGVSRESLLTLVVAPVFGFFNVVIILFLTVMIGRIVKMPPEKIGTFGALCSIPNSAYIGYPIIISLLGEKGLTYAVAYDTGACLALWTVVVAVMKSGTQLRVNWRQILNPALVSVLVALAINLTGLKPPEIITEPIRIMGQANVPLAMTVIGYSFLKMKLQVNKNHSFLILTALVKLILYPLVGYVVLSFFRLDSTFKSVVIIIAAMPSMASAPVIVEKFGGDVEFATSGVFLTTILGMLTIPLLLYILS
ncbi:MAG TPA: hypothetical protein DDZ91_08000 [Firmicutes bacterium]|nr:hypothetical protein [Bacillota bacterium]